MNFQLKQLSWYLMPSVVALAMAGCGSDSSVTALDTSAAGPVASLPKVATPGEAATAQDKQLIINVVDTSGIAAASARSISEAHAGWNLFLWNGGDCSALDDTSSLVLGDWGATDNTATGEDQYGPSWTLPLSGNEGCVNFILRNGTDKLIGSDMKVDLSAFPDRTVTVVPGNSTVYDTRAQAFNAAFGVSKATAHLVAGNTLLWPDGDGKAIVRLYWSPTGQIGPDETDGTFKDGYVDLTPTSLSEELKAKFPHLKEASAFTLPAGVDLKALLKDELVAIATDAAGIVQAATQVQTAGALDDVYAAAAKQLQYGAIVADNQVTFRLWAPTAQSVKLALYDADKSPAGVYDMVLDPESGAWSYQGSADLKGKYYRYQMQVYHPVSRKVESYEVTDPYSLSLSMNSKYSQVVDLDDPALKPEGWDALTAPHSQAKPSDVAKMVVHESHVRDLTAFDTGIPVAERGKYVALTDDNSLAVQHLKSLSAAGVTHLQLLPVADIATINEDPDKVADLEDPFSKLCAVNAAVRDSSQFNSHCSGDETVAQVLGSLDKDSEDVQALNRMVSETDSFNWGYDPYHYTAPEGSYATNAEGSQRILEFRKMVQAIKEKIGMNVVMDVVYNHTNEAGLGPKSVLDKVVPWYYQRLNTVTGSVENSTCCSNSAPEHAMFAKLMDDSLVTWARDYKIDAFRFDLMGHHPKAQMEEALAQVKTVNPQMYFYGEGWNFGEVGNDARFEQATQQHLAGTGIGSFSDRLRDVVRGGSPFDSGDGIRQTQGFGNGAYVMPNETNGVSEDSARHLADLTRLGMAGNLKTFVLVDKDGVARTGAEFDYNGQAAGYAQDPIEIQNYVSKHDNQTIFDNIAYKAPADADMATRVRMQALSLATVMLGQGTVFDQEGTELLRSKSFERDSYDSGDWYNRVDYTKQDNNYDVGLPRKDKDEANYALIQAVKDVAGKPSATDIAHMESFYQELARLRQSSPLFTLGTGTEVMKRVDFRNVGPDQVTGLIAMTIDDGTAVSNLDSQLDGIVTVINATNAAQSVGDFADGDGQTIDLSGFELSPIQQALGSDSIGAGASYADGQFTIPAWSVAVFTKPQTNHQGAGLPVGAKAN